MGDRIWGLFPHAVILTLGTQLLLHTFVLYLLFPFPEMKNRKEKTRKA